MKAVSLRNAAFINLISNYINVAFIIVSGILLVPLYLHFFSIGTYGAWLASGNVIGILSVVDGGFNLVFAQRLTIARSKSTHYFCELCWSGLLLGCLPSILLVLIGISISSFIPGWINADASESTNLQNGIVLSSLGAGFSICYNNIGAIFQSWHKTVFMGFTAFLSTIFGVIAILLGLYLNLGVSSLGLGIFIRGSGAFLMLFSYLLYVWKKEVMPIPSFNPKLAIGLIKTVAPVFISRVGNVASSNSQAFIVSATINPESAAILALTGKIYDVCQLFLGPIGSSIYTGFAHFKNAKSHLETYNLLREITIIFSFCSTILFSMAFIFNKYIVHIWVGDNSYGGLFLSILLCLAGIISSRVGLYNFLVNSVGEFLNSSKAIFMCTILKLSLAIFFIKILNLSLISLPLADIISMSLMYYLLCNILSVNINLNKYQFKNIIFHGYKYLLISLLCSVIIYFIIYKIDNKFLIFISILISIIFYVFLGYMLTTKELATKMIRYFSDLIFSNKN